MFRRRPLMRAAVVGGGAYMAGKAHARNQAERQAYEDDQNARIDQLEQQQYQQQQPDQYQQQQQGYQQPDQYQQPPPPPPPAAAPAASSPMIDQLNQLAALHQQGVLTDDEFAAAKAKLFGGRTVSRSAASMNHVGCLDEPCGDVDEASRRTKADSRHSGTVSTKPYGMDATSMPDCKNDVNEASTSYPRARVVAGLPMPAPAG